MFKRVFEGEIDYEREDGGQALIATICDPVPADDKCTMFVRVQSWDEKALNKDGEMRPDRYSHKEARTLQGKRVRVTIEEIP